MANSLKCIPVYCWGVYFMGSWRICIYLHVHILASKINFHIRWCSYHLTAIWQVSLVEQELLTLP